MESFYTVADRQTTIGGLLPLGRETDFSGMDVCADRVSIFAMQGNHMGPKKKGKKGDWGQRNMMSDSQDERELSANVFVQNCVSAASSRRCPLVIGLGLNCYSSDTKEMYGYRYKDSQCDPQTGVGRWSIVFAGGLLLQPDQQPPRLHHR